MSVIGLTFFMFIGFLFFMDFVPKSKNEESFDEDDIKSLEFGKPGDSFVYLMILSAYFIKQDNDVSSRELGFVKAKLEKKMPPDIAYYGMKIINKALEQELDAVVYFLNQKAKSSLSYSTKLGLLQFLMVLCVIDNSFTEERELSLFAMVLGISKDDYKRTLNLLHGRKLRTSDIFNNMRHLVFQDIKISDYIFFNKVMGNYRDVKKTKNEKAIKKAPDNNKRDFSASKEELGKIDDFDKGIRAKALNGNIEDLNDKRIKQQVDILDEKLHLFLDILSQKMDASGLNYNKYKQSFEQVYMMALENIKNVISSQKVIESIDKEKLQQELEKLQKAGRKQHVKAKQERLKLFEEETNRLNEILLNNERPIQEMEMVTFEIGRLKGEKGEDQKAIKEAIRDLDEWTDKVKLYNKS